MGRLFPGLFLIDRARCPRLGVGSVHTLLACMVIWPCMREGSLLHHARARFQCPAFKTNMYIHICIHIFIYIYIYMGRCGLTFPSNYHPIQRFPVGPKIWQGGVTWEKRTLNSVNGIVATPACVSSSEPTSHRFHHHPSKCSKVAGSLLLPATWA